MMTTRPLQQGYTLLELSVVLAVLGLLVAGGLTLYQNRSESIRVEETRETIEALDKALKSFFARNRFLPCPADGRVIDSAVAFGVALAYDPVSRTCPPPQAGSPDPNNLRGMVPVRTLGLPDAMAYDGWGRRISYQLSQGMGDAEQFRDEENTFGEIHIFNPEGLRMTHPNYRAAYVLVSHGANGFYAWPRASAGPSANYLTPAAPGDAGVEIYNQNGSDFEYMLGNLARDFDDIGLYRTKMEIYQPRRYARRIAFRTNTCNTARALLDAQFENPSGVNPCSGTAPDAGVLAIQPTNPQVGFLYYWCAEPANAAVLLNVARTVDELCRFGAQEATPDCAPNLLWQDENGYQNSVTTVPNVNDARTYPDCWCPGNQNNPPAPIRLMMDFDVHNIGQCVRN